MKKYNCSSLFTLFLLLLSGWVEGQVSVTFQVNMSNQTVGSNGVHLAGSIQGWNPATTAMIDADGDNVYEVTVTALAGATYQYKFINGNDWPQSEAVPQACGVDDGFGGFNRNVALGTNDTTLSVVCFGACENCQPVLPQDSVSVTFQVNMSNQTVGSNGVHLAGSIQGWNPTTTNMVDSDGDNVYEVTVTALAGATYQYKFINGNDWPQSEVVPQACGVDDGFGGFNRNLILGTNDTTLSVVCFGACENCLPVIPQDSVSVTFQVNMSNQTVGSTGVHLAGSIQGWNPATTAMLDADGDDVYEVTLTALAGATYQYKFINGNDFNGAETVPQQCGVNDGSGIINRNLALGTNDTTLSVVCFGACENCLPVIPQDSVSVTFQVNMSNQTVGSTGVHLAGSIQGWNPATTAMLDTDGDDVYEVTLTALAGATYQYKFINGNDFNGAETVPQQCGLNDGFGGFNRNLILGTNDTTLSVVCFGACENCQPVIPQDSVSVTFQVNMSNQTVGPNGVHLAGSIQGWNPATTAMLDADGDDVYEVTLTALAGATYPYKFINGNDFNEAETVPQQCGLNDGFGGFNRNLILGTSDTTLSVVCFGACENCPPVLPQDSVSVTFQVNMSNQTVSPNGVHLAGSIQGWNPATTAMIDADGDDVYEVTVTALAGATYQYKFINGNDFNEAEIVPQQCGLNDGFGGFNRNLILGTNDTTLSVVCFGACENCPPVLPQDSVSVTFQVNMSNQTVGPNGVHLAGSIQGWNPATTAMLDADGDNVYEVTLTALAGATYEYKFINGNDWPQSEAVPQACGVSDGFGGYNRQLILDSTDVILQPVCYSSCENCVVIDSVDVTFSVNMAAETISGNGVFLRLNTLDSLTPMVLTQAAVYEVTMTLDAGQDISYRFVNGNTDESVPTSCSVDSSRFISGTFNNQTLSTVCFGECANCGNILITLQVNMREQQFSSNAVYAAGNFSNWSQVPMLDVDQDSIFTLSIDAIPFDNLVYKFVNGTQWENVPQECGLPDGSNNYNRVLETGELDVELPSVCFGSCADCASSPVVADTINVTFMVNMENQVVSPDGVHLAGSIQGWDPATTLMTDLDGDSIYEVTLPTISGQAVQFKFINGITWSNAELVPSICGLNDGNGAYNRYMLPSTNSNVFGPVCFGECVNCGDTLPPIDSVSITFLVNMANVAVDPNGIHLAGNVQGWNPASTEMTDPDTDGIYEVVLSAPVGSEVLFKFINGNDWPFAEVVPASCGVNDGFGNFNRQLLVPFTDAVFGPICFAECADCGGGGGGDGVDVTFQVNMATQSVSAMGVHLAGSMQGWNPASTEMLDGDGDGVYSVTLNVPVNSQLSYKFINGNDWPMAETVPQSCGVSDGFGGFNRQFNVGNTATSIPVVCFSECTDCGGGGGNNVNVTFNVNMANQMVSPLGVHLAGNIQGWDPAATEMLDNDGDGTYTVTLSVPENTSMIYKFINGNDWPLTEVVPAECGIDDGFGGFNRSFPVGTNDINIQAVCFGECSDCSSSGLVDVTFRVNIAYIDLDNAGAFIAGSFNAFTPTAMIAESDSVYAYTISLPINSLVQFKFLNGADGWEAVPFECGVDDGQGGFNRQISIDDVDVQLNPICFATCTDCGQVGLDEMEESSLTLYPNPTHGLISVQRNSNAQADITITDATGRIVYSSTLSGNVNSFDVSHLSGGIYYLRIGDSESLRVIKY